MSIYKLLAVLICCAVIMYAFAIYNKRTPVNTITQGQFATTTDVNAATISKKPVVKKEGITELVLTAESVFVLYVHDEASILHFKEPEKQLPIASITKLMTALVIKENLKPDDRITISKEAVEQYETAGQLTAGQTFTVSELMYPLLIESSNDAAYAFAETFDTKMTGSLVSLMNAKAKDLGMTQTIFNNVSGLDARGGNLSTAKDLALLAMYIYKNHPDIFKLTNITEHKIINEEGTYNVTLKSTNTSLTDPRISLKKLGGKTGETPKAQQTLLLITESPRSTGHLIHIILNSTNRHDDMATLVNWVNKSFTW